MIGANDRVRIGCIGVGYRGVQVLNAFLTHKDAEIVALCDVYEPYLNGQFDKIHPHFKELTYRVPSKLPDFGGPVERHKDFRRILDKKDIDAVIIATPDHWHAVQTIMACDAGKDVYIEKPLSLTVREGRRMVQAARRNNRVVQVGTQRRSSKLYAQLAELVQSGAIGKVTVARAGLTDNMSPVGIGKVPDSAPPEGLDWDMWLGPRAERPFNLNILPYKFRWWNLYSSQMANWGAHYLDAMRWITRETAPASISAHGGIYAVNDCRTNPDTAEVIFEHASGMLTIFSTFEASGQPLLRTGEIELRGTLGTAYASMNRIEIVPERGGAFQDPKPRMKPIGAEQQGRLLRARHGAMPAISSIASSRGIGPTATSRRATARPAMPSWPISPWPPDRGSTGTLKPSDSPTTRPPTHCSTTNTASPGRTCKGAQRGSLVSCASDAQDGSSGLGRRPVTEEQRWAYHDQDQA